MPNSKPMISLIGGDMRQAYLALSLQQQGYCVTCYCIPALSVSLPFSTASSLQDAIERADYIIGGIPFSKGEFLSLPAASEGQPAIRVTDFLSQIQSHQILIAGALSPLVRSYCTEHEITCFDFMQDNSFAIFNAVATAEGSIAEAIFRHPSNLQGSRSLVLGYGRCARILAEKLKALHSETAVCARNETDRAYAYARGMQTLSFTDLPDRISAFTYIFNTVPALVLTDSLLQKMKQDALIIDIASAPGGVDYPAAAKLGIQAALCPGLPGRYAAQASAEGMLHFLLAHTDINANLEIGVT